MPGTTVLRNVNTCQTDYLALYGLNSLITNTNYSCSPTNAKYE
jgi:hypothetical protein